MSDDAQATENRALITTARRKIPSVNYAYGVAGVASAGAMVTSILGYGRATAIILGGMLVAMLLLLLFSRLAASKSAEITSASVVLLWAVLLFFITFLIFTATAFAFGWPSAWAHVLGISRSPTEPAKSVCLSPNETAPAVSCGHSDGMHVVSNIPWDDSDRGLVVREVRGPVGTKLGVLAPNATEVIAEKCEASWCQVQCKNLKGWASQTYLTLRSNALYTVTGVGASDPQGLIIRDGPSDRCPRVGSIPHDARNILVHSNQPSPIDRVLWSRVTYSGESGWVPQQNLQREK